MKHTRQSFHFSFVALLLLLFFNLVHQKSFSQITMATGFYQGTGLDNEVISGVGFQPDVIIIKVSDRDNEAQIRTSTMPDGYSRQMVGGTGLYLFRIKSFTSNGFIIGNNNDVNAIGKTYYWTAFKSNSFLKVGSFIGDGTDGRDITGIGFQPDVVFLLPSESNRASFRTNTFPATKCSAFGSDFNLPNTIEGFVSDGFTVGDDARGNKNGAIFHYVAFKATPGSLKTGSYEGDGINNRTISGIGFKADYMIVKSSGSNYATQKSDRMPDSSSIEFSGSRADDNRLRGLFSDGFVVGTQAQVNSSSHTYHYICFKSSVCNQTLSISKVVDGSVPDNDWSFSSNIPGHSSFTISKEGGSVNFNGIPAGTYTITENNQNIPLTNPPRQYSASNNCGTGTSASVTVNACAAAGCVFTNSCQATLTISNILNTTNPLLVPSSGWEYSVSPAINGESSFTIPASGGTKVFSNVPLGVNYVITQTAKSDPTCLPSGSYSTINSISLGSSASFTLNDCRDTVISFTNTPPVCERCSLQVNVNSPNRCSNGGATTITASPSPAGIYNYSWTVPPGASDPGNVSSFSASAAGTYSVTVTDNAFCSVAASGTLTVNAAPTVTVNSPSRCSNGGAVTINATPSPAGTYTYAWTVPVGESNPGSVSSFSATAAGTYSVTITDGNSCSGSGTGTLTVNNAPTVTVNSPSRCSNGGGATIAATPSPSGTYTYAWTVPVGESNPGSASSFSATAAGTYSVTITDGNSCSGSGSGTLTVNSAPTVTVNSPSRCSNGSASVITATPSPSGTYTYAWTVPGVSSNPGNVSSFSAATGGTYSVTITDGNSCSGSGSGTLTVYSAPTVTVNSPSRCSNGGAVTINATPSPAGTYTYAWTVPVGESNPGNVSSFSATAAGTYSVTITDGNSCSGSGTGTLLVNNAPTVTVNSPSRCSYGGAVTITATPSPSGTYTYAWTVPVGVINPGNVSSFSATAAGTYSVTITDGNSCSGSGSGSLTVNSAPTVTVNSPSRCSNSSAAVITATPSPSGTYTYAWTVPGGSGNPGNVSSFSATVAGTYSVTITDGNSCSGSGSGTLTVNSAPTVTVNSPSRCSNGGAVVITATPSPASTYTYAWTVPGGASNPGNVSSFSANAAGTYSVTITDGNSCSATGSGTLTVNPVLTATCTANNLAQTLTAIPSGGTGPYTYSWNTSPIQTTQTITVTDESLYTVTVTDSKGCTANTSCSVNTCNGIFTVSQGGWGAQPKGNNPGQYLKRNFSSIFPAPDYLTVGCSTGNKLRLTTARAVEDFLPSGSTPRSLPAGTLINPGGNYNNVFAGLVVALTINMYADLYDANLSASANNLRDLIVNTGSFAGWTVGQVLTEANKVLGGCPSPYSINDMNNIVDRINNNYELGQTNGGILSCPGTYPLAFAGRGITTAPIEEAEEVTVFPNPFAESTRIRFRAAEDDKKAKVVIINSLGEQVALLFEGMVNKGQYYITCMNTPQLSPGIYYYRIITGNRVLSGKIMKAK